MMHVYAHICLHMYPRPTRTRTHPMGVPRVLCSSSPMSFLQVMPSSQFSLLSQCLDETVPMSQREALVGLYTDATGVTTFPSPASETTMGLDHAERHGEPLDMENPDGDNTIPITADTMHA